VHARRVIAPVVLLVGWAVVHAASRVPLAVEDPIPRMQHVPAAPPATIDELRARIAAVLEREHVAGGGFALIGRDGPIWVGGVGVRDRATGAPVEADTAFRVGSLTKTVIALGVMRLVDQGKLDLDRPLREILPDVEIDNPWDAVAPVTLAHCLEHTSGIDDVRFNEIFTADEQLSTPAALALNPRSRHVRWRPGTRHAYSNVGYTLAGRAIEVATGEPFDLYLKREILAPLGITDADFRRTDTLAARLATGYLGIGRRVEFLPFAHRPAGALLASASDLGKLVQFWIRRGDGYPPIVSPAGLARIERNGTLPYAHLDSEYGLANYGDVTQPVFGRGHDGGMPGFHSTIRYYPELGAGYVMVLNSNYTFRGYRDLRALLFAYLTRGRALPPPPAPATPAPADRPGAEYFALASPTNEVFGFLDEAQIGWHAEARTDRVRLSELAGATYDVIGAPGGGYRFPGEYGSAVRFTAAADGTPVMVTGFWYAEAAPWLPAQLRYIAMSLAMLLLHLAPLWAAGVLGLAVLRRRHTMPTSLVLWPAVAGLSCIALPRCLEHAFLAGVIGRVHPLTVTLCALTILFAIASVATLVAVIRWSVRPDRPRALARVFPTVCAVAFVGLTVWFAIHGLIGFRTWAW
jgi:CubicO group peptidase (beta-lactamase class C family)